MDSNWNYSPKTTNLGQIRQFFVPCELEIHRWPWKIIGHLFYATSRFVHHFLAIGKFKQESWSWNAHIGTKFVLTSVTLTFDLWPWPFAWTALLSMVITYENSVMIRWEEHSGKGVTDRQEGQTDRRTERSVLRAAWSQLKMFGEMGPSTQMIGMHIGMWHISRIGF